MLGVKAHPEASQGFKNQACDAVGERKLCARNGVRVSHDVKVTEAMFGVTSVPYDLPRKAVEKRLAFEREQCP